MHSGNLDALKEWFDSEFLAEFHTKYGVDAEIAVVILDPSQLNAARVEWETPLKHHFAILLSKCKDGGDAEAHKIRMHYPEGLIQNVVHKLRFVLRTGLDSREARNRLDLLEPGDFPYDGAGTHLGYIGGASGLNEESDWWVFARVVEKLVEIRAAATADYIAASKRREPGMKYLGG